MTKTRCERDKYDEHEKERKKALHPQAEYDRANHAAEEQVSLINQH